jgi:hypothetical protein
VRYGWPAPSPRRRQRLGECSCAAERSLRLDAYWYLSTNDGDLGRVEGIEVVLLREMGERQSSLCPGVQNLIYHLSLLDQPLCVA